MRIQATCCGDIFDAEGEATEIMPLYNGWLILQSRALTTPEKQAPAANAPAREYH